MAGKISVKKIWGAAFDTMVKRPIVLLPFVIIAFIEALALEFIYFSNRPPLSLIAGPIISKLSGEIFLHYPFNLAKIPRYFFYVQLLTYILAGIALSAITVNMVRNIKGGLPLKTGALVKNALRRYGAFAIYGVIAVALMFGLRELDVFAYGRLVRLLAKNLQVISPMLYSFGMSVFYFFTSLVMHTFFVMVIPIMVIEKKSLLKGLFGSMGMGLRRFLSIIVMIFIPYALYFPITMLKSYAAEFSTKLFPEVTLYILGVGILAAIFVDCFVVVCATYFLLGKDEVSA